MGVGEGGGQKFGLWWGTVLITVALGVAAAAAYPTAKFPTHGQPPSQMTQPHALDLACGAAPMPQESGGEMSGGCTRAVAINLAAARPGAGRPWAR